MMYFIIKKIIMGNNILPVYRIYKRRDRTFLIDNFKLGCEKLQHSQKFHEKR